MNRDGMRKRLASASMCGCVWHCPILLHPDYTVGPGISPDLLTYLEIEIQIALAGFTAGGDLHPALRTKPARRLTRSDIEPHVLQCKASGILASNGRMR